MSGDSHNNDDADFLDEDFVVEDIAGKNEELEELFDEPDPAAASGDAEPDPDAAPDEDDVLFTDHTQAITDETEKFERKGFEEEGDSEWNGELLDLESVGVPDASLEDEEAAADPKLEEAKESFSQELDSMLHADDEFEMDAEQELEVIDAQGAGDGISEFEQSGPFVLDDGEGAWTEDADEATSAEAAAEAEMPPSEESLELQDASAELDPVGVEPVGAGDSESSPTMTYQQLQAQIGGPPTDEVIGEPDHDELETLPYLSAATGDDDELEGEAGWEPLESTSMDDLSEVDEVQPASEEGYEDEYEDDVAAPEYGAVGLANPDLEDVDGHDIYADEAEDDQPVVLGGPGSRRGRTFGVLISIAASLLIVLGGAVIVVRPEWFGLRFEPARVERVDVPRPVIELAVTEPASLAQPEQPTTGETGTGEPGTGETGTGETGTGETGTGETGTGETGTGETGTGETGTGETGTGETGTGETGTGETGTGETGTGETGSGTGEAATGESGNGEQPTTGDQTGGTGSGLPVIATPDGGTGSTAWPVAETPRQAEVVQQEQKLARFGDDLMVGGLTGNVSRLSTAVNGVLPGSRAFAQLHNGNYFIGSVKHVNANAITLRVDTGEVTIANDDIAQLTQLGSADYEELQKATRGFVRLTNNNRLIGGILSRIADDHVVLEFRSNRVMLPKSLVGEIVSGQQQDEVRLDTTTEEDNWVRKLVERELGTGKGVEASPKPPAAPGTGGPPR